jgi:hypothetical protein
MKDIIEAKDVSENLSEQEAKKIIEMNMPRQLKLNEEKYRLKARAEQGEEKVKELAAQAEANYKTSDRSKLKGIEESRLKHNSIAVKNWLAKIAEGEQEIAAITRGTAAKL